MPNQIDCVDFFFKQAKQVAIGDSVVLRSDDANVIQIARRAGFERDSSGPDNWIRRSIPRWTVNWVRAGSVDMDVWHDLFESCFGYRMSKELENWKYARQDCLGVFVFNGDKPVAFYGALTRQIIYFGEALLAAQICDVMVHPCERGVLTRKGPFFLAAATFLENKIGVDKKHILGFGFPTVKAMQTADKMRLYASVGELVQITWESARQPYAAWRYTVHQVDNANITEASGLWKRMAASLKERTVGVRDSDYIKHRYLDHPVNRYNVLLIKSRWTGKSIGMIVCREHNDAMELVDIIAPVTSVAYLIAVARDRAAQAGKPKLFVWMMAPDAHNFCGSEGTITSLDISVPTSIWENAVNPDVIKNKWWLMAGDSDFR